MISELIKKDFSYTKRVNFLFVIIVAVLTFFSAAISCVNYNHLEGLVHQENEKFVYNVATFYSEQQLKPLEYSLVKLSSILNEENVSQFVKGEEAIIRDSLMAVLSVTPAAGNIIIAKRDGSINSVPTFYTRENVTATERPWFKNVSGKSSVVTYTDLYMDMLDETHLVTISKSLLDEKGEQFGVFALDLNLTLMSYPLRQLKSPSAGRFLFVDRMGRALLDSDTESIASKVVPESIIRQMTSATGTVYDAEEGRYYYYYSFSNPDWFVVLAVNSTDIHAFTLFDIKIILVAFISCVSIYLMLWFFMNQSIKTMIIDIVSMMRFGRLGKDADADKQIINELFENKNEMQKVRNVSLTDGLTNLLNRRCFDNDLHYLIDSGSSYVIGIIDIDNFKAINDEFGHLIGDTVLKIISQIGLSVLDEHAKIYRYGGEEIAFIYFSENQVRAIEIMEKWRRLVESKKWREESLTVTFSGGLCPGHHEDYQGIISKADKLLYKAKSSGKNKIVIATS